jgi:hypothetical protein
VSAAASGDAGGRVASSIRRRGAPLSTFPSIRLDPWLAGILLLAAALFVWHLSWGLPNGNSSWAADAIGPVTTLGIVHHSFSEWNSGWYFFKYPLGYPFLLFLVATPYLAWLRISGGWHSPSSKYPYGFDDPESALLMISMTGRLLSVAFALGTVAVTYAIGNRLLGRWPARIAAFGMATAYPIIYYAHTTNLDIGYLFWLLLALYAAIVAAESQRAMPWATLGVAAAMAVSSKEQGFAFLLPLPLIALAKRARRDGVAAVWSRGSLTMAAAAVVTALLANNVLYNPMGFVARLAFLLGRPLEPVSVRLAPVEFALWKGAKEWVYVRQLWDGVESTLGTPLVCLAILGLVSVLFRHRRAALWLLVPAACQYYLSLRGLDLITLRYLLPISAVAAVLAGLAVVEGYRSAPSAGWRMAVATLAVAVCGLGAARALETLWLFDTDPRYRAEEWLATRAAPGEIYEYYQKKTYVPRFRGDVSGRFVEMEDRSVDAFVARNPAGVVLSSASDKSIAHRWNPDWRETRDLLAAVPEALRFQRALENGELGYREAASFRQDPALLRLRITSLAPEIKIYVRD